MNSQASSLPQLASRSVALEALPAGWICVWLDSDERSVNVLDRDMLQGLEEVVRYVETTAGDHRGLLLRSRKQSGFFAGADVQAIAALPSPQAARAVVQRGQQLMNRVAALPIPTLAVIDGLCLGGGLELAMSCRYRLATAAPSTRLGLPEIRLGLIPGWGGTRRLLRWVGLRRALSMILSGSTLSARAAQTAGLIDHLVEPDDDLPQILSVAEALVDQAAERPLRRKSWSGWWWDHSRLGQWLVCLAARRRVASKTRDYPALTRAIEQVAWAAAHREETQRADERECEAFCQLLFTPTARNLLQIFLQRDQAKKAVTWVHSGEDASIPAWQRIAVIGAGAMGAGIGLLAATRGLQVVFKEVDEPAAERGRQLVEKSLQAQAERRGVSADEQRSIRERMHFTSDWQALGDCHLAIEAVVEVESVKREVFQQLEQVLSPAAVLASNTSSLQLRGITQGLKHPERVAGLHFFNPVERMELVEVVRTETTQERVLQQLLGLVRRLGKTPVVTADQPGFLVNRVLFPYLREAVQLVIEGARVADVDRQLRQFGMPMGPLELIDQVGVDIASHVSQSLTRGGVSLDSAGELLSEMTRRGWLGKKAGRGFYEYSAKGRRHVNRHLPVSQQVRVLPDECFSDGLTPLQRRVVYAMLNEAMRCLDDQVVTDAWMVDLGMVLGTGFAPQYGGPLRLIDRIGVVKVEHNLRCLAERLGERFTPADGLSRLALVQAAVYATELPPNRDAPPAAGQVKRERMQPGVSTPASG